MSLLADLYSTIDSKKRQLRGLLSDPLETLYQGVRNFGAEHQGLLDLQARAYPWTGNDRTAAPDLMARKALADAGAAQGMAAATVWHGSPHKFDKFDSSKIGTGEGAQAYGHGLYLAESPDVAKSYQRALSDSEFVLKSSGKSLRDAKSSGGFAPMMNEMMRNGKTTDDVLSTLDGIGRRYKDKYGRDAAKLAEKLRSGAIDYKTGSLYKVDLPDEAIAKMLDWDKPLSQQAPDVREALTRIAQNDDAVMKAFRELGPNAPANQAYAALTQHAVRMKKYEGMRAGIPEQQAMPTLSYGQDAASLAMRQQGIPGIRYLDGGSRGTGAGTSNFVVFPGNEGLLSILERNGMPIK